MTEVAPKKVPTPFRGVDYRGKVVLAPMVRSGELPTRLLALHYGADLVWGQSFYEHSSLISEQPANRLTPQAPKLSTAR